MGMFDSIYSEYKLPKVILGGKTYPEKDTEFQTKCLENGLFSYTLREDGRLFLDEEDVMHHGYITMYTSIRLNHQLYWLEYKLKYTDGILVDIFTELKKIN